MILKVYLALISQTIFHTVHYPLFAGNKCFFYFIEEKLQKAISVWRLLKNSLFTIYFICHLCYLVMFLFLRKLPQWVFYRIMWCSLDPCRVIYFSCPPPKGGPISPLYYAFNALLMAQAEWRIVCEQMHIYTQVQVYICRCSSL